MNAIGWTLIHFVWQGLLVAAVVGLASLAIERRHARLRYALGCAGLLAMAGAPVVTLALLWPEQGRSLASTNPPVWFVIPSATPSGAGLAPGWRTWVETYLPFLVSAWMVGATLLSVRSVAAWWIAWTQCRVGRDLLPALWKERLDNLRASMGIAGTVQGFVTYTLQCPATIGWLRPVVLVPAALLSGLTTAQVEAVLAHELAHIQRHDYLVNLLQTWLESLLFYHPAVWWLSSYIRREREACCDQRAIEACGDPVLYSRALLALEENRMRFALSASDGDLRSRVARITGLRQSQQWRSAGAVTLSAALAVLAAWPLVAATQPPPPPPPPPPPAPAAVEVQPVPPAPPVPAQRRSEAVPAQPVQPQQPPQPLAQTVGVPQPPPPPPPPPNPYRKWITEDVVYLIAPEEAVAFNRLNTDEERERFIEQFWLRRDPTPGTVANEMKDEHYRRIAYANQRFSSGKPGWATDRGAFYIVYGPPDEMEVHPGKKEAWLYRHLPGIGDRVIVEYDGQGKMTVDPRKPKK